MDKEIIKKWLNDIATPTGISYSGDRTISENMVEKIVDYVDELEQQAKKQKEVIDKAIEFIDYSSKEIDIEDTYNETVQTYSLTYDDVDELLDILNEVSE